MSKPGLRVLLERYEINKRRLKTVIDLHKTPDYKVSGREGVSKGYTEKTGLHFTRMLCLE